MPMFVPAALIGQSGGFMRIKFPIIKLAILFLTFTGFSALTSGNPRVINEAFALRNVRILHGAEMVYSANLGNDEFTSELEILRQANLIDPALSTGYKHFYSFTVTAQPSADGSRSNFTVSAVPTRYGKTGKISLYVDILGEIHGADKNGAPATVSDPIVGDCSTGSISDNERCTVYSFLRIRNAQRRYFAVNSGYATLPTLSNYGYIDARIASGEDRGFLFQWYVAYPSPPSLGYFRIGSQPRYYGQSGRMSYYLDETGVIRGADRNGAAATVNDPPITVY